MGCRNFGDITKIDWDQVPDFDLFTYSSPCQDFSNAGLQRGGEEGSGTRSSLLWECRRAIVAKRPKYCLLENVKALASKKFMPLFNKWQDELAEYGYANFWQVLNAKNCGVPQNRERVFLWSILRTEADPRPEYHFPRPFPLELRLKDVLEESVDEKYYLSDTIIEGFEAHRKRMEERGNGFGFKPTDGGGTAKAVLTTSGTRPDDNYITTEPLNAYEGGVCRTIKAQYQQSSRANFIRQDGLGATGVIQYEQQPTDEDDSRGENPQ